ncbi:MDR family MFS transporter [Pseudodonghicola flavimaris]|uniref:MDR family MFS transporter n=1 Tax=Pseudodonghicola flavimaris TaxID=3050036 RepID=A0ABT7EXS7_9RHOB|nr:MDR family MFS transporter [Pseudodonghicola flavimaris]MDK3017134.1 MDR family MFS transporter [Pseudodonghicola flavimaris]
MPAPTPSVTEGPDSTRIRLVILAAASVLFIASLGQTVVTTALPTILSDLGGLSQITWVITAYLMAATVGAPVCGKLGDLFGRKRVMQGGIVVFLLGSLLCALAPSLWVLVAGRAVQGLGGGGLIVVSMASVADAVPPRERGRYQGMLGSVFGVSTVIGPLAGGFIVQHAPWEWLFLMNVPLGLVAFAVLSFGLPKPHPTRRPAIDYPGAISLALTLSLAVVTASLGGSTFPWQSPEIIGLSVAAVVALVVFILIERRAREPILPLQLFRINNFVVSNVVGLIVGTAMFGTITFVPFFMQVVKGMSPALSGMFTFPMMVGIIGASFSAGQIMMRTGRYRMLPVFSTLLLALAMISLATATAETPNWRMAASMVLTGIGIGPVMGVGVTAIQNAVPLNMVGIGTASANMFRLIGGSIGTAIFGAIFSMGLTRQLGGALGGGNPRALSNEMIAAMEPGMREMVINGIAQALHPVFWIAAGSACIACLVSLLMVERPLDARVPLPKDSAPAAE